MSFSRRDFAQALIWSSLFTATARAKAAAGDDRQSAPGVWEPHFFSNHDAETYAAVAEVIIPATDTPGAREALVHQHVDKILLVSVPEVQNEFLQGLWWLDGYALRHFSKPFRELAAADQHTMLASLLASSSADLKPGREFVAQAKRLTSHVYYSTEIGHRELNKHSRVPSSYFGICEHQA